MGQSGFSFDLSLTASGNPIGGGGSAGFSTLIRFSVDTPTLFALDSAWSASGLTGNGATVLGIILDENVAVFSSDQQSNYIAGVSSAIDLEIDGAPGGNNVNTVSGLQNGTLLPGINYRLIFSGALSNSLTASDNTATSSTSISFTPVPEPGTLALLAFGVAALGIARRRYARVRPGCSSNSKRAPRDRCRCAHRAQGEAPASIARKQALKSAGVSHLYSSATAPPPCLTLLRRAVAPRSS